MLIKKKFSPSKIFNNIFLEFSMLRRSAKFFIIKNYSQILRSAQKEKTTNFNFSKEKWKKKTLVPLDKIDKLLFWIFLFSRRNNK